MTNKPMLSVERELLEIYTGRKEGDWVEAGHELRALLDKQSVAHVAAATMVASWIAKALKLSQPPRTRASR